MLDATAGAVFGCPDLTVFCRLDELGLHVIGLRVDPGRAVLACRVVEPDDWCRRCGCKGVPRDTVTRALAHEPWGWRPTLLLVTVRRYRCSGRGHVWRQDTSATAQPRSKLSRRALRWALEAIVCQYLTVARVAEALGVAWHTANDAVLAEGRRVLIADPHRFDAVAVIGVDEHVWRHTSKGDEYVTVIIDLTATRDRTTPARLRPMPDLPSRVLFGAAYYHEYEPQERLESQLDLMAAARFSVIWVGESVWSTWEPEGEQFNLGRLQPVLNGAHERGISVIVGTPTCAVPPWLVRRYTEIAGERRTGQRLPWGPARRPISPTRPSASTPSE